MQQIVKWLRSLGPIGSFIATILTLLTANWVVVLATVASLWAGLSDWATAFVQKPGVRTFAEVFLVLLWGCVAIVYLARVRKPITTTPQQDFRYGLTFEGLVPFYDAKQLKMAFGFGVQLRNFSSGPIRYEMTAFEVRIGTRSLPKLKKGELFGFMPRGGGRTSSRGAFTLDQLREFMGETVTGTVEISIEYGHPELPPVRRLDMVFETVFMFPSEPTSTEPLGFNSNIKVETDVAIKSDK